MCVQNSASGLIQIDRKVEKWQWFHNFWHEVIVKFFWLFFFCLVKFSYWSKFHVNIITGSGVMTISFYKGFTRNPEIGKTLARLLPNIWRLGWVKNTKFGRNVSNKMLLNSAKCQGYSFYRVWVINGETTGGKITPPPTRLGLSDIQRSMNMLLDTRFHIWLIMTLYYKIRQKFITKCVRFFITKCDSCYKMQRLLDSTWNIQIRGQ